jgi:DNA-directed RNA polymerase subunit H (RpoH/RPB5)
MASVRELLVREVERLSEEDAREVLDLLKRKQAAGIHVADPGAPPFEKLERIRTRGIPASKLLIADRR